MKKIFTTAFLPLLFCATLFAENFVVTDIIGQVKYETQEGTWKELNIDDKVKSETVIHSGINSLLELTDEGGKVHIIENLNDGSIDSLLQEINAAKKQATTSKDKLIEEATMPDYLDKIYSDMFSEFGFESIKSLPSNKNVVRLCSVSNGFEFVELTWTKSSASIVCLKGKRHYNFYDDEEYENIETGKIYKTNILSKTERKITKKEVKRITDIIKKTKLYKQPSHVYHTMYSTRDGIDWYIEANINGSYKSIEREYPFPDFLKQLGDALYDLAKEK